MRAHFQMYAYIHVQCEHSLTLPYEVSTHSHRCLLVAVSIHSHRGGGGYRVFYIWRTITPSEKGKLRALSRKEKK